jgi:hypothetical protein
VRTCQETEVHEPVFGSCEHGVRANSRLLGQEFVILMQDQQRSDPI